MIETERLLRRPTEEEVVRVWLEQWERFPTGKFLVARRSDGAPIGRVGATYYDAGYGPHAVWVHPR